LYALIQFFAELCLLRRAPQDLPASTALLGTVLLADVLVGAVLGLVVDLSPAIALAEGLVDIVFTLGLLYLALRLLDRLPRFLQTATALLGAGAMLEVVAILPLSLLPSGQPSQQSALAGLLLLGLIGWSILVTGHILRHSFDLRLAQGVVIAVAYNLLAYSLISGIFSGG
jgi:hypothetical protein